MTDTCHYGSCDAEATLVLLTTVTGLAATVRPMCDEHAARMVDFYDQPQNKMTTMLFQRLTFAGFTENSPLLLTMDR